jgi:hypothetical protein
MTWLPTDRRLDRLALVVGTLFACYLGLYATAILAQPDPFRFGDFFALWSYGKVLAEHPASELYDAQTLVARQIALGMPSTVSNPFPYPPNFLPVVWPLGQFGYLAGYAVFMALTFGLYLAAVVAGTPRPRLPLLLAAVVAPTSTLTLVAGQSGFLAGALFLGGMRLAPVRPVIGGVLLGLLAYKPQLGLLVPVALVAGGQWRCIAAAAGTVGLMAFATSAAFGWHIWADWLAYLPVYADQFERESTLKLYLMPTLAAALHALSVPNVVVVPAQAALALAAVVWIWRESRRGPSARALLALATGTFLAAPHAFVYDLPMFTGAVLLFVEQRLRGSAGIGAPECAAVILALCFPAIMLHAHSALPIGPASLALLAAALLAAPPPEQAACA